MATLAELEEQIRNCYKCADLCKSRRQPVPGVGSECAKVVIIGLAPGRNGADVTGIPFRGDKTGELLRKMIRMIDLLSEDMYITNIVKCNPKDEKGRNRIPTQREIENCLCYLKKEVRLVRPKIIVTLGVQATEVVIGKKIDSMERYNSRILEIEGKQIFPMFHPGYVVRGAYDKSSYERDFRRLKCVIKPRSGIVHRLMSFLEGCLRPPC